MGVLRTIPVSETLLSMVVIETRAEGNGIIYLRLPVDLQRECGGCKCDHCRQNPLKTPMWDTLAVSPMSGTSWTVHMPDPRPKSEWTWPGLRRKS